MGSRGRDQQSIMKIAFSSSICPDWDLSTLVEQAQATGYRAIELCEPQAGGSSASWSMVGEPARAKSILAEGGIELICLATGDSFHWPDRRTLELHTTRFRQTLDLAARLECPFVIVKSGSVPRFYSRDRILQQIVETLRGLAHEAAERRVTILVENSANIASSRDMWYILDAVSHPSVRVCWNPRNAHSVGDAASLAVPRIGRMMAVTHMADAVFADDGTLARYVPVGQGQVDLARYLLLTRGIHSDTHLVVNWPAPDSPPEPAALLAATREWIEQRLSAMAQAPELSAYKGDKNAPRFASSLT